MRIWLEKKGPRPVLIIDCETDFEATVLNDFLRVDEPLVAVLKHAVGFLHPHLEIRKERP